MILEYQRLLMLLDTVSGMTGGQGINRLIYKESTSIAGGDNFQNIQGGIHDMGEYRVVINERYKG